MAKNNLSALVSARLCHDLISPMGAIGNGLELLQMNADSAGTDEIALIGDSLESALAKLRFYRVAFGPADPDGKLTLEEASQLTDAMYRGRFTVSWTAITTDMPRPTAQIVYLAILCLEKSLPMGGLVRVSMAGDTISLSVDGHKTAPPADLWSHVTDGAPIGEIKPAHIQFPLLREALIGSRFGLSASFVETGVDLSLKAVTPQLV